MRTSILRIASLAAVLVALPAAGAVEMSACATDPAATGLAARVETMQEKMDRIRFTHDKAERSSLLALHDKLMREGLQELRKRNASLACRMEMTDAMMDQLMLHQQVAHDGDGY